MRISIRFNKHDLWVGVYWFTRRDVTSFGPKRPVTQSIDVTHVFVCLLPCLPIEIVRTRFLN